MLPDIRTVCFAFEPDEIKSEVSIQLPENKTEITSAKLPDNKTVIKPIITEKVYQLSHGYISQS